MPLAVVRLFTCLILQADNSFKNKVSANLYLATISKTVEYVNVKKKDPYLRYKQ